MVGLEKTGNIIDRCTVCELLYLRTETDASRNLEGSLLKLYTVILKYLAKAIRITKG
jgi:hypothetical protein